MWVSVGITTKCCVFLRGVNQNHLVHDVSCFTLRSLPDSYNLHVIKAPHACPNAPKHFGSLLLSLITQLVTYFICFFLSFTSVAYLLSLAAPAQFTIVKTSVGWWVFKIFFG